MCRYKRAVAQKRRLALSTPYEDAFGAGLVISLSKAVYEGRCVYFVKVMNNIIINLLLHKDIWALGLLSSALPSIDDEEVIFYKAVSYDFSSPFIWCLYIFICRPEGKYEDNDPIIGVLSMDFQMDHFYNLITGSVMLCEDNQHEG